MCCFVNSKKKIKLKKARTKPRYVELGPFDAFYEDYIEFKNYIRDFLEKKKKEVEVAATKELEANKPEAQIYKEKEAKLKERPGIN